MALLSIDKTYADGKTPFERDLENIRQGSLEFFNIEGIDDDTIQAVGITASDKFLDNSVTANKIASSALNATNLSNNNVNISIADLGVETADLLNDVVTTVKFLNLTITSDDFLDADITYDKIATGTVTTDGSDPGIGNYVYSVEQTLTDSITENATFTDVETAFGSGTPLTAELTTQGGPIAVSIVPVDISGAVSSAIIVSSSSNFARGEFRLTRDGASIAEWRIEAEKGRFSSGPILEIIDDVVAGNYEYRLQFRADVLAISNSATASLIRILAFEL